MQDLSHQQYVEFFSECFECRYQCTTTIFMYRLLYGPVYGLCTGACVFTVPQVPLLCLFSLIVIESFCNGSVINEIIDVLWLTVLGQMSYSLKSTRFDGPQDVYVIYLLIM